MKVEVMAERELRCERRIDYVLDRTLKNRALGPYRAQSDTHIDAALHRLFAAHGLRDVKIDRLRRMTGGASKEQFSFTLAHAESGRDQELVLRMDPLESIAETCRGREAQILRAMQGDVPVPQVVFVDVDGEHLGFPGLITAFVDGVTMPTQIETAGFTGIGGQYGEMASILAPQFIEHLAAIHDFSWADADLSLFDAPQIGTNQAALWQINWFSRVWRQDRVEASPLMAYTERWLRDNAPASNALSIVHGDYRMGNFMFREPSGDFTAILDWELAHIGDFHEDVAYVIGEGLGSTNAQGDFLVCGLMTREAFLDQYARATGREIDPSILFFYEVLNTWKVATFVRASAPRAALGGNNHNDVLLSWMASSSSIMLSKLGVLLARGPL